MCTGHAEIVLCGSVCAIKFPIYRASDVWRKKISTQTNKQHSFFFSFRSNSYTEFDQMGIGLVQLTLPVSNYQPNYLMTTETPVLVLITARIKSCSLICNIAPEIANITYI